jgi:hypothetical protein
MRFATGVVIVSGLACWAGCDSPETTAPRGPDAEFGGWTWNTLKPTDPAAGDFSVCAAWGSWKKKLAYVILTDGTATSATDLSTALGRTRYDVFLTWPGVRTAEFVVETADGRTGTVAHAGRSYDLSRGAVFVVVPKRDRFDLRQLVRDTSGRTADLAEVVNLIRGDPELVRTFARRDERK